MVNLLALRKVQRTWILIKDGAGYSTAFEDMWSFIIKDLGRRNSSFHARHDDPGISSSNGPAATSF
jgi:hypothetical protein